MKQTEATFGTVDILVNNAGTAVYSMMKNVQQDLWDNMIDINIKVNLCFVLNLQFNNIFPNFIQ